MSEVIESDSFNQPMPSKEERVLPFADAPSIGK